MSETLSVYDWEQYKNLIAEKILLLQYSEFSDRYDLFASEAGIFIWTFTISKNGGSEQTDFETNFKANANKPLMQNGSIIYSPSIGETQVFINESIRDTNTHNSLTASNSGYRVKTIIYDNQLNQIVIIQCQGSRDNTNWFNVGTPWQILATTAGYQTCDTYLPYMRAVAQCSIAPTIGNINIWFEMVGV